MKPSEDSDWRDLNFTWVCVDFKPTYFDIEVNFTRYQNVSIHDFADTLRVKFNGHWYFRAKKNNQFIPNVASTVQKKVPPQMDPKSRFGDTAQLAG